MPNESWLGDLLGIRAIYRDGESLAYPQRRALVLSGPGISVADDPSLEATRITFAPPGGSGEAGGSIGLKAPARVATTTSVPLSGLLDVDGVPVSEGDRVLVKDNVVQSENGLWIASEVAWSRAPDADSAETVRGVILVPVSEGDANGNSVWLLATDDPIEVGTTPLVFRPVGSGDAESLQGLPLDEGVGEAEAGLVLVSDGAKWIAGQLSDAGVHDDAAIKVRKLQAGSTGQVLRSLNGRPAWSSLSVGDFGESVITTPTITSDQNNYAPAGWGGATVVRLTADAPRTLNGLAGASVKRKVLVNVSPHAVTLAHDAGGQAAGNRILTTRQPFTLAPGESVGVLQDVAAGSWRVLEIVPPAVAQVNIRPLDNEWTGTNTFRKATVMFAPRVVGYIESIPNGLDEEGAEVFIDIPHWEEVTYVNPQGVASPRLNTMAIPLSSLVPASATSPWFYSAEPLGSLGPGVVALEGSDQDPVAAEFRVPTGSRLYSVFAEVQVRAGYNVPNPTLNMRTRRRRRGSLDDLGVVHTAAPRTTDGDITVALNGANLVAGPMDATQVVFWGAGALCVRGVYVTFWDPGPRNT